MKIRRNFDGLNKRAYESRRNAHMSQAALSEKSGVSIPQIKNIESGKSTPHDSTLELLSEALNVSVDYLKYGGEDVQT